jgi:hypothetical protein
MAKALLRLLTRHAGYLIYTRTISIVRRLDVLTLMVAVVMGVMVVMAVAADHDLYRG